MYTHTWIRGLSRDVYTCMHVCTPTPTHPRVWIYVDHTPGIVTTILILFYYCIWFMKYTLRILHMACAMSCFVVDWHLSIFRHTSGLIHMIVKYQRIGNDNNIANVTYGIDKNWSTTGTSFTNRGKLNQHLVQGMKKYLNTDEMWDVITHPYPNFNCGLGCGLSTMSLRKHGCMPYSKINRVNNRGSRTRHIRKVQILITMTS